jgi:hypothetical protein
VRRVKRHEGSWSPASAAESPTPGYVYLEVTLTLQNVAGETVGFSDGDASAFLNKAFLLHRTRGQPIKPWGYKRECLLERPGNPPGLFSSCVLKPDKKEKFSLLFEILQDAPLDDLELYLPGALPLLLGGSR